jgi:hypothetical protein
VRYEHRYSAGQAHADQMPVGDMIENRAGIGQFGQGELTCDRPPGDFVLTSRRM